MKLLIDQLQIQAELLEEALQDIKDRTTKQNLLNAEYHYTQVVKLGINYFGEDALQGFVLIQSPDEFKDEGKEMESEGVA